VGKAQMDQNEKPREGEMMETGGGAVLQNRK